MSSRLKTFKIVYRGGLRKEKGLFFANIKKNKRAKLVVYDDRFQFKSLFVSNEIPFNNVLSVFISDAKSSVLTNLVSLTGAVEGMAQSKGAQMNIKYLDSDNEEYAARFEFVTILSSSRRNKALSFLEFIEDNHLVKRFRKAT